MYSILLLGIIGVQPAQPQPAGVTVAEYLKPAGHAAPWKLEAPARKLTPAPAFLERPEAPLAPVAADPERPAPPPATAVRPRTPAEDTPFAQQRDEPPPPERPVLPAAPLVRLPVVDLGQPPELPPLAKFVPERAPLADVTAEASLAAALAGAAPVRANPEPFVRYQVPDPFEFRATRLPPPPAEKLP